MSMVNENISPSAWINKVIKPEEYKKYMKDGKSFIDDDKIWNDINSASEPTAEQVREIMKKSYDIKSLTPAELATLMRVKDPEIWKKCMKWPEKLRKKFTTTE